MNTHYATLGLLANASPDTIRQAYRRLVLLTHPDRTPNPAAHQRFLAVNDAYDVLSNPTRRAAYDAACGGRRLPSPHHPASAGPDRSAAAARLPGIAPTDAYSLRGGVCPLPAVVTGGGRVQRDIRRATVR
ncbi:hypothetical protein CDA63_01185 [Hymenobacter amundsenii]|uniref:J domain-containing protein n=1 Tax=Hymenobacter amundsenii TaxID=2006685 RepID=A0A246FQK1_9BACT|nr:J domain-containing protein [Hymenobacter amundsenii]OWP65000.1 hypothetical protein CDA63_01185 [Hymenobacter amundsenii]